MRCRTASACGAAARRASAALRGVAERPDVYSAALAPTRNPEASNGKARVITKRAYGFRTSGALDVTLYHALGELPETRTHPQISADEAGNDSERLKGFCPESISDLRLT